MMFKVLTKGCEPSRGSKYSAAVDLYASEDVVIGAGETAVVGLGVAIEIDWNVSCPGYKFFDEHIKEQSRDLFLSSHYLQVMLRSSLGKKGLIIPNGVGVIDLDYKDEIKIIVHNPITDLDENNLFEGADDGTSKDKSCFLIKKGDKIAQITILEHKSHLFGIDTEDERVGGFGSTDK